MNIGTLAGIAVAALVLLSIAVALPSILVRQIGSDQLNQVTAPKDKIALETERLRLMNEVRTTLLQVVTALVLIVGAYFTWNQIQDNQESLQANLKSQQQQLLTEGFSKAVEQLGEKDGSVRMGGMYALKRISTSFPEQRFAIADILSSYIRLRSPWPPSNKNPYQPSSSSSVYDMPYMRVRAPDIQVALTLLGTLSDNGRELGIVLTSVDLRLADLRTLHLEGSDFRNSHLEGAALAEVHLEDSALGGVNLTAAATVLEGHFSGVWDDKRTVWPEEFDKTKTGVRTCIPGATGKELEATFCTS